MIIFNKDRLAKEVVKNGICDGDFSAKYKMKLAATYLKCNTTYCRSVAISKLKKITVGYFYGMPDSYVDTIISDLYDKSKATCSEQISVVVTIYQSEMNKILKLEKLDLQKMAFVFLVYSKYRGFLQPIQYKHKKIEQANSDMFRLAGIKASGTVKNNLLYNLTESGMVEFESVRNKQYWHSKTGVNQKNVFSIPYQNEYLLNPVDKPIIYIRDFDNMILYFKRFIGEDGVDSCNICGAPIIKSSNSKKFCDNCAIESKRLCNKKSAIKVG